MWRKGNARALSVGMWNGTATVENSMEFPKKIKNKTSIWSSNSTSGYESEENESSNSKRCMHTYVHCSIIYNSQDTVTT